MRFGKKNKSTNNAKNEKRKDVTVAKQYNTKILPFSKAQDRKL